MRQIAAITNQRDQVSAQCTTLNAQVVERDARSAVSQAEIVKLRRGNEEMARRLGEFPPGARYTEPHVQDIRARLTNEFDGRLHAKQDEVNRHVAEIRKLRQEMVKLGEDNAKMAVSADATSQQAGFIRKLREQAEQTASEATALRRKNEDYMTSSARTEATLQGALAQHSDQMAVQRHEKEALSQRLLAQQRANNDLTAENVTLSAYAEQLRTSIQPKNDAIALLTLQTDENNTTIQSLRTQYHELYDEGTERFDQMIEPAVLQEHVDKHKTRVDGLLKEIGKLQTENTELTDDKAWFQGKFQEDENDRQPATAAPPPPATPRGDQLPVGATVAPPPPAVTRGDQLPVGAKPPLPTSSGKSASIPVGGAHQHF